MNPLLHFEWMLNIVYEDWVFFPQVLSKLYALKEKLTVLLIIENVFT